ncbi:MFS transporter [Salinigranum rubrum]|uniref:MFS transporter n=1 Tax=Salinigranum rubrum TaxID=755307 RepID=A0A2I8VHB6_9EURY|nr:MFS transporter [Salinigranum rubrum]AUV81326.1 MFS transporter [Salinigranum rubrum]
MSAGRDRSDRLVVFVLWLLVFATGTQALIVAPIIPRIATQLGTDEALLGTLITAYSVSVGVFALVAGPVSDRVGRHRVLLVGSAAMTVALALHWFVWDFASLVAVRALAGVAGGVLNGAAVAYVGDYFAPQRRGWANGWVFSGFAAGQIAGIPLGSLLATGFGFRTPFIAFAALLACGVALVRVVLPVPTVTLSTDRLTVRSAVSGYASLLRRPEIAAATLVFVVMFGGNALYTTYLPTWLESSVGLTAGAVAGMFLVGGVANVLAGPRAGVLSDRVGRKRVIVAASVGVAVVMAATPFVVGGTVAAYVTFFLAMGLFASRATPFQTLLTELVSGDRRGSLMSLTVGVGQVGSGVGGAVAGVAFVSVGYAGSAAAAAVAMVLIGALIWVYLPETTHSGEGNQGPGGGEAGEPAATPPQSPVVAARRTIGPGESICGPTAECGYCADDD